MKFKFWKKTKPTQGLDQAAPEGPPRCRCFIIGLDDLGLSFQVGYDHNFRGSRGAWYLAFTPSYSWKCQTFGADGPAVVKGIGLDLPVEHRIEADGKLTFYFQERPTDVQIFAIVKATEDQVAALMKRYGETKEILACLKKGSK